MPLTAEIAEAARIRYLKERDRYDKLAREVHFECRELVDQIGVQASVQYRAKDAKSFKNKLLRYLADNNAEKIDQVANADDAINMIGDLAGIRIATYVEADRARVVELIRARFRGTDNGKVVVDEKEKALGYRATHCQVLLPNAVAAKEANQNIADTSAEIQVCSMLAHVWNEIEHDMRYKVDVDWGDETAYRELKLSEFRAATVSGDACIEDLLGHRSEVAATKLAPEIVPAVGLDDFAENRVDVIREFVRLGYSSTQRIDEFLAPYGDWVAHGRELIKTINHALEIAKSDKSLRLGVHNADVMLALLLEKHGRDLVALYRGQLDLGKARRVARIAEVVTDVGALE